LVTFDQASANTELGSEAARKTSSFLRIKDDAFVLGSCRVTDGNLPPSAIDQHCTGGCRETLGPGSIEHLHVGP
jgi:hypothetical protein